MAILLNRKYRREEEIRRPVSDEEQQRLQLLRLLKEQSSTAPSPELVRNTYRFDLPES